MRLGVDVSRSNMGLGKLDAVTSRPDHVQGQHGVGHASSANMGLGRDLTCDWAQSHPNPTCSWTRSIPDMEMGVELWMRLGPTCGWTQTCQAQRGVGRERFQVQHIITTKEKPYS